MEPRLFAIIPAAGSASRMGFDKLLTPLAGASVLNRVLAALAPFPFEKIVLACPPEKLEAYRAAAGFPVETVAGGKCRAESVFNALRAIDAPDADRAPAVALVHDCARPFVSKKTIEETIRAALAFGAAVAAKPCVATVKESDGQGFVAATPDRSRLFLASTPQCFSLDILKKAYENIAEEKDWGKYTDEAMLAEKLGQRVKLIPDSPANIKLTTKEDWDYASWLIEKNAGRPE